MFVSRERGDTPKPSASYSFSHQEQDYFQFRPRWSTRFAQAALERLGVYNDEETHRWSGINGRERPVIVSIGSGAGSDAEAFLQIGCIVYGVEPNAEFRELSTKNLGAKYPGRFYSVDGTAHQLNLPSSVKPDLMVCAQALHTFSSDVLRFPSSEALARQSWKAILPDDNENRISIWHYNLDPIFPAVPDLDQRLRKVSPSYAKSKTSILYAPLFEPSQFQHYISADKLSVSTAQPVHQSRFHLEAAKKWLKSFSFYPKDSAEEAAVLAEFNIWFELYKNQQNEIELNYIGFIAQGPLRATPYFQNQKSVLELPLSPLTLDQRRVCDDDPDFWPHEIFDKTPFSTKADPIEMCVVSSASRPTPGLWGIASTLAKLGPMLYSFADTAYESLPSLLHSVQSDQMPSRHPVSIESASIAENAVLALAFSPLIRSLMPWWFKPMRLSEEDFIFLHDQLGLLQEYQRKFPTHTFNRAKKLRVLVDQFSDLSKLIKSTNGLISQALKDMQISSTDMSTIINKMNQINQQLKKLSNSKLSHEMRKMLRHKVIKERRMDRRTKQHGAKNALQHHGVFSQSQNLAFEADQTMRQDLISAAGFRQIENSAAQLQLK